MLSIISKKIIKPFTPTPSTQRWHKLSHLDQGLTHMLIPFVFFYPKNQVNAIPNGAKQISDLLANSLSKTLTCYYPWAGSLKDNATIECDDNGAEFLEVQINSPMDNVVNHPDSNVKDLTFPQGVPWGNDVDRTLTIAQLSYFECGGIAISACLSHKIGDARRAYCFLRDWAALTRSTKTIRPSPYFVEDSILPSPIGAGPLISPIYRSNVDECVQKRFIFSSAKLSALKSSIDMQNVTSNEAVNALLYKCAASSAAIVNSGSLNQSQLFQFADMRDMTSPQLPPNSIGNILSALSSPIYHNKEELKLSNLVVDIRKSKDNLSTSGEKRFAIKMLLDAYGTGKCDVYLSSNLCKFPFIQDLDFGFGEPIRASIGRGPYNKVFFLMRTHDGGIEALVHLNEQDMSVFEHDKHLLEFATPVGHS
ncbi:hypothetical protein HAX54_021395 [Datura stramonium]|uniref:Acylsugar acyltransferase 3-like n=1 Tax=Datura stramonium TaxID=4076 RepID=A0ABS8USS0_DATST|nr:hypothetical protein [Datura stramonium]